MASVGGTSPNPAYANDINEQTIATSSWPRVNPPKPSTSPVCEAEAAEAAASDDDRVS